MIAEIDSVHEEKDGTITVYIKWVGDDGTPLVRKCIQGKTQEEVEGKISAQSDALADKFARATSLKERLSAGIVRINAESAAKRIK